MSAKKMLLVFNPISGKAEFATLLFEVVNRFTTAGYVVTAYPTQGKEDAYRIILEQGTCFDIVCCSGGDGTLSEAIHAMMHLEKRPPFAYIPSGTTNDFASSLKIPKNILEAVEMVVKGNSYPIDVGRFEDKYFAYVAAFGLFTEVTYDTPQTTKNMLGHAAYVLEGVKRLRSIKNYECKITIDSETISGNFIFGMISNSTTVGGFKIAEESRMSLDDGLFEVVLIKSPKSFADLHDIVSSLLNGVSGTDALIIRKASEVRVVSKTPVDWTLDGEFGGSTNDILIENKRRAIEVMIPRPEVKIIDG